VKGDGRVDYEEGGRLVEEILLPFDDRNLPLFPVKMQFFFVVVHTHARLKFHLPAAEFGISSNTRHIQAQNWSDFPR
jgi:hypothetical protein